MNNRKGFSLIELMGVLVIIGLILLVVIPSMSRLLTSNDKKQYEQYVDIIKAGAIRYSDSRKDDLGGDSDTGCIEIDIQKLIEGKYIKKYIDDKIECNGNVRVDNVNGNLNVSINLNCLNKNDNKETFNVNQIDTTSTCIAFIPSEDETNNSNSVVTLVSQIFKNNNVLSDKNIDFSKTNDGNYWNGDKQVSGTSNSNGLGLYETSDLTRTEDIDGDGIGEKVYYFRGAVTKNYVRFGKNAAGNNLYWRIVRINEDGSIRLIYQGTSAYSNGANATIGSTAFNSVWGDHDNADVGYMYGERDVKDYNKTHANINNSSIKGMLDNWYANNIKDTEYETYIVDPGFCNDRSLVSGLGYTWNKTIYDNGLSLKCPQTNDLFTTSTSDKGNKMLTYPIGLITADEVVYAGSALAQRSGTSIIYSLYSQTYYLYRSITWWTMTPNQYNYYKEYVYPGYVWYYIAYVNAVIGDGTYEGRDVSTTAAIRPVINLSKDVILDLDETLPSGCTAQIGTSDCPYIIRTS